MNESVCVPGNYLVTGASRGLGFALTQTLLRSENVVFALCRNTSDDSQLKLLSKEFPHSLFVCEAEITDELQLQRVVSFVRQRTDHLDVIINNAAVLMKGESIFSLDIKQLIDSFAINAVAPVEIAKLFLFLLKRSKNPRLINISSNSGVTARVRQFNGLYSYKASKSALNMLTRIMALELEMHGISVIAVDPSWMRTDMGGADATASPESSAAGISKFIQKLTLSDTDSFLTLDGEKLNW